MYVTEAADSHLHKLIVNFRPKTTFVATQLFYGKCSCSHDMMKKCEILMISLETI